MSELPPPQLPPPAPPGVPPSQGPVFQPGSGKMSTRQKRILLGIVGAFVAFLVVGNALGLGAEDEPSVPARSSTARVVYQISGAADVGSLTFETPTGSAQRTEQQLPTEIEFQFRPGSFLYVSVQNDTDSGSVQCVIRVDGKIVSQNEAAGAFAIAQCQGRA